MRATAVVLALALSVPISRAAENSPNCDDRDEPKVSVYPSPTNEWTIYVSEEEHWMYSIVAKDKSGKVVHLSSDLIPKDVTVKWLSADLGQITWPCGTGCLAMRFMNSHGVVSRWSYKPVAVDIARQLLAEASDDEVNSIDIAAIFRTAKDPVKVVKLPNASNTASGIPVTNAKFLPNGKLFVHYFTGTSGFEADLEIDVPEL